jgi:5-methylcytosine-specific restriction endonuclease McrA
MVFNRKEYNAKRYLEKKEEIQTRSKSWNENNKDKAQKNWEIYYQKNRETLIEKSSKWNKENREKFNENQRKNRDKVLNSIRVRLNQCLTKNKNYKSIEYLGCSIQEYKLYLEQQFTPEMIWENYGTYWEIDHIVPLSKGGSFHYTNTQPLTITENRKKSNKLF